MTSKSWWGQVVRTASVVLLGSVVVGCSGQAGSPRVTAASAISSSATSPAGRSPCEGVDPRLYASAPAGRKVVKLAAAHVEFTVPDRWQVTTASEWEAMGSAGQREFAGAAGRDVVDVDKLLRGYALMSTPVNAGTDALLAITSQDMSLLSVSTYLEDIGYPAESIEVETGLSPAGQVLLGWGECRGSEAVGGGGHRRLS